MLRMWRTDENGIVTWEKTIRCGFGELDYFLMHHYWDYEKWEYTY